MYKIPTQKMKVIKQYLHDIGSLCHLDSVFLFGSHASGQSSYESDIDIAIFSREITNKNRLKMMTLFLMKSALYNLDIQPLIFSYKDFFDTSNSFITNEIKKKGLRIAV